MLLLEACAHHKTQAFATFQNTHVMRSTSIRLAVSIYVLPSQLNLKIMAIFKEDSQDASVELALFVSMLI